MNWKRCCMRSYKKYIFAYTGLAVTIDGKKSDFCSKIIDIAKGIMYNIEIVKISLFICIEERKGARQIWKQRKDYLLMQA